MLILFAAHLKTVLVFFFGCQAAPYMALGFVNVQDHPGPGCQGRIDVLQSVRHIFMYRTLTDPKFFRRLSYCRFCFYYVMCNLHCTFFDIILQRKIPRRHRFYSVCGGFMWYVLLIYLLEEHRNNINSKCNDRRNNCGNLPDIVFFVHLCFFFRRWLLNLMRSHQSVSVLPQ